MRHLPDSTWATQGGAGTVPVPRTPGVPAPDTPLEVRDPNQGGDLLPTDGSAAMGALFELHYAELVRLARHLLDQPADAEDVVMDAFAALELRWHRVRQHDDAFFYLRTSVVNGTRSRLRRLRVARAKLHTQLDRDAAPADQTALVHLEHEAVRAAIRSLPRRQREVLVLRYYAGALEAEIADTLGISLGSVKAHASRGLHRVTDVLEGAS
jgi:RNA polymerase sigma-70 factor (sigma-E family)